MRPFLRILTIVSFLFTSGLMIGCGGPADEVLDYDPNLSEQKSNDGQDTQKRSHVSLRIKLEPKWNWKLR